MTGEPDPITAIQSERKLKSDPAKIRTQESLKDMPKLEAIGFAYAVSGKDPYAAKARELVLAWAKRNRSARTTSN